MVVLGFALAALIGLSLGMLGGGGSVLTVPVFVYVLGFGAKQAIAMSLPVVGTTSLVGALGHWRAGNVDVRVALGFGAVAMVGSYLGAHLAALFSGSGQLLLLAVVMIAAAVSMLRGRRVDDRCGMEPARPERARSRLLILGVGLAVGVLTGLVGIGGGFLIVPALVLLARVPIKQAVGTSLVVIAMNAAAGFTGYLGRVSIPWLFMAGFTAIAILGILAGAAVVRFVSPGALRRAFGVFLIFLGTLMFYENRHAIVPSRGPSRDVARER